MKWNSRQIQQKTLTQITLDSGNRLMIRQTPEYKLQTLYDRFGQWVKSKLHYYSEGKLVRTLTSKKGD